ncbi:MAG: hypothetical protein WCL00_12435, partial [Bacteroidota bacterium]
MKTFYQNVSKALIVMMVAIIPFVSMAQTKPATPAAPADTAKVKVKKNPAPTHSYWAVTGYAGFNQFNGDLSKNLLLNDKWTIGAGLGITKQFSRV